MRFSSSKLSPVLIYSTVRKVISISEAKTVKMPTGQIKWLPSQRALLREIVVINLMGALNCSGRLMCGMCWRSPAGPNNHLLPRYSHVLMNMIAGCSGSSYY